MADYRLITDATCDMNLDLLEKRDIDVIPMEVVLNGKTFLHYPDFRNCSAEDFYGALTAGGQAHTAQITPQNYFDFFTPILKNGEDILYVCFSSGLSGTYQSSVLAVNQLRQEFPDRKIYTVDSLCACGGEGMFAMSAADNRDAGMTIEENAEWLEQNRLRLAHYFTTSDLFFLKRGGRVSAAAAIAGTALQIKPVLIVDEEGKLPVLAKAHGRRASISRLLQMTKTTIENPEDQIIYISQGNCMDDALLLKQMVLEQLPVKDVIITTVGPVIGCHTGPTLLCIFSYGRNRRGE